MFFSSQEPPLHQAVIDNDPALATRLLKEGHSTKECNALGFNAVEIAEFLGRDKILSLFDPKSQKHLLNITFPGLTTPVECSPTDLKAILRLTYRSHLYFSSYPFFKKTCSQAPWLLRATQQTEENQKLFNRFAPSIRKGEVAQVEVKWIDAEKGYGLFALTDLPADSYVGEYTGEVRQLYRFNPDHNPYCFHYPTKWWSWNYLIIDGLRSGNELRFVNHDDFPNLEPRSLLDRGLLHLFFVTTDAVQAGEELTLDYGADYWKKRRAFRGSAFRGT